MAYTATKGQFLLKEILLQRNARSLGLRLGQLVCVFLHRYGFNGVLVSDNYNALSGKKRKKEIEKKRQRDVACEPMRGCVTFACSASRTEVTSRTRPRPTTTSAWSSTTIKQIAFCLKIIIIILEQVDRENQPLETRRRTDWVPSGASLLASVSVMVSISGRRARRNDTV